MSRLQVGGLALIIKGYKSDENVGKVVRLISFHGDEFGFKDLWSTTHENLVFDTPTGKCMADKCLIQQDRLIPLGDKQTQDELAKEKEFENV